MAAQSKQKPSDPPAVPSEIAVFDEGDFYAFREANTSKTIYVYDRDTDGKSHCDVACAETWHPVVAPVNATPVGNWSPIARDVLSKQWAYKGKPLYTNANDAAEETRGDGVDGAWHTFKP